MAETQRVRTHLPVSDEVLAESADLTTALGEVLRGERQPAQSRPAPEIPAGHRMLLEATGGTLRAVVEHHAPVWGSYREWQCEGCDGDGYDWEPPYWPCSTAELIADRVGVVLREGSRD